MCKYIVLFYFILFCLSSKAQGNMVSNGNFEVYSTCPSNQAQITLATGWSSPTTGTPDYYNSCASYTTGFCVPNSGIGYQQDFNGGGAYAGIYVFNKTFPNTREYIQIKLSDTLNSGRKYLASMYISRWGYDFAISSMGMYFSGTAVFQSNINVMNFTPQVKNATPLTDTLNWMLVQDTITGTGSELYLTIGNFSNDSLSDTLRTVPFYQNGWYAYYYIDNVSVIDVAEIGINEIDKKKWRMSIFPNPSNGEFVISSDNGYGEINLTVEDISGKIVYSGKATMRNKQLKLKLNLENGVYLMNIEDGGMREIHKLILAR